MKRISRERRFRWRSLSERRGRRSSLRRLFKRDRLFLRQESSAITVSAPEKIMLEGRDEHHDLTVFLAEVRRRLRNGELRILIDFTKTQQIVAGGGLLMYAEFQRLIDMFPFVRFLCRESKVNRVSQILQYLGIYKMLGHASKVRPQRADVISWRHAKADEIDCTGAGKIIEAYASLSKPVTKLLFKAASEAISNTINHAYEDSREDGLPDPLRKSWWMFCREYHNRFYMAVCDLGVGIPRTLTVKNTDEIIGKIFETISAGYAPNDAQMIYGAMEYARTRTDRPQQGKGLMDLRRIIEERGAGKLHVFSNRGCVTYDPFNGYRLITHQGSIYGTVVVWSVPIGPEGKDDGA